MRNSFTTHATRNTTANGVSERRNRTLLDMVRSMMSLTDLPLSFWGYTLETAAFTLSTLVQNRAIAPVRKVLSRGI